MNEPTERYLDHLRVERRLAEHTLESYRRDLRALHGLAEAAGVALEGVETHHVRRWAATLHSRGLSGRSIARTLSAWRGLFRWMGRHNLAAFNPAVGVRAPKSPRPLPKALSIEQAVGLAGFEPEGAADPRLDLRDRAIVELFYSCGLRLSELAALDLAFQPGSVGWLDLTEREAHVLGKGGKRRSVPVGAAAAEALQRWLAVRAELAGLAPQPPPSALFVSRRGSRLSVRQIQQRLKQRALQAGIPADVHPHVLRHSFASHLLQSSGDLRAVQELLGHANVTTTQVYTKLDFQHLAKIYDAAHPRAKKSR